MSSASLLFAALAAGCAVGPSGQALSELTESQQEATGDAQSRTKVHTELDTLYLQAGNMGVALQEARVAVEANPNYAPAYNLMGLMHRFLWENTQVEADSSRAWRFAPGDPEIVKSHAR